VQPIDCQKTILLKHAVQKLKIAALEIARANQRVLQLKHAAPETVQASQLEIVNSYKNKT
jgi:hypothetical protein